MDLREEMTDNSSFNGKWFGCIFIAFLMRLFLLSVKFKHFFNPWLQIGSENEKLGALAAAPAGGSAALQQWRDEVRNPGRRRNRRRTHINSQDGYFSFSGVFGGGLAVMDGLAATLHRLWLMYSSRHSDPVSRTLREDKSPRDDSDRLLTSQAPPPHFHPSPL